ncbi:hypothetical protein Tco_0402126 [Tanacetum coccineum]
MSTQQDIYATGSENHPPMLNKENYVPWSSRLLCCAKSRPNGKLIYNSIMNGPKMAHQNRKWLKVGKVAARQRVNVNGNNGKKQMKINAQQQAEEKNLNGFAAQ